MIRCLSLVMALAITTNLCVADDSVSKPNEVLKKARLVDTRNVHIIGNVMTAGQPSEKAFEELAGKGYKVVVSLRRESEESFDEAAVCKRLGMKFVRLPIGAPEDMTAKLFQETSKLLRESKSDAKVLLHCASANRVGAIWLAHRVKSGSLSIDKAQNEAAEVGLRSAALKQAALDYLKDDEG